MCSSVGWYAHVCTGKGAELILGASIALDCTCTVLLFVCLLAFWEIIKLEWPGGLQESCHLCLPGSEVTNAHPHSQLLLHGCWESELRSYACLESTLLVDWVVTPVPHTPFLKSLPFNARASSWIIHRTPLRSAYAVGTLRQPAELIYVTLQLFIGRGSQPDPGSQLLHQLYFKREMKIINQILVPKGTHWNGRGMQQEFNQTLTQYLFCSVL